MIYSTAGDGHKRRRLRPWQIRESTTDETIVPPPPDSFDGNPSYWRQFHVHQYESSTLVDFVFENCKDDLVVDTRGFHKLRKEANVKAQCVWTADQRGRLYNGLSRFSINQVDLIKEELLPEKSELEILQFYFLMKKELAVCQSNEEASKMLVSLKDFPISYEMSETYIALEEKQAAFLQQLELENRENETENKQDADDTATNGVLKQKHEHELNQNSQDGNEHLDSQLVKQAKPILPNELDATQVSSDEELNTEISSSSESSSNESSNEDYEDCQSLAEDKDDTHPTELLWFKPTNQTTGSLQVTQLLIEVAKKYLRDLIFVIIKNQIQAHALSRNNLELSFCKMSAPEVTSAIVELSPYWHLPRFRDEKKEPKTPHRKRKLEKNTENTNIDIPWSYANDEEIRGTVFQDLESTKKPIATGNLVKRTYINGQDDSAVNSSSSRAMLAEKKHLVKLHRVPSDYQIPRKDSFIKDEQFCIIDSDLLESFFIKETDHLEELDRRNSRIFEHNVLSDLFKAMKKSPVTTRTLRFTLTSRLEMKYRQLKNEKSRLLDTYVRNGHLVPEDDALRAKMKINSISDELMDIKKELEPDEVLDSLANPELGKFKLNATYGFEGLDLDELYRKFTFEFANYEDANVE